MSDAAKEDFQPFYEAVFGAVLPYMQQTQHLLLRGRGKKEREREREREKYQEDGHMINMASPTRMREREWEGEGWEMVL